MMTIEELNERLDKLAVREQETEAQRVTWADWFKNATALEERLKIHDNLKGLNDIILGVQEERQTLLNAMKIQLERGVSGSPNKKLRRSLPPPTSGSEWTFEILKAYLINIRKTFSLDDFLFQPAPPLSDRARCFTDDCSVISFESIMKANFPSKHQACLLAKHLYLTTSSQFGHMEASIDDAVLVLFDGLGFNDGDLVTVSRNRLNFQMSNKMVCADADLTVFNLKTLIRLAVVEDKRADSALGASESGEPQLIAESVAAAMYNQKILDSNTARRAISEPPLNALEARTTNTMNTSRSSEFMMFMIRVSGQYVFFYSHKFSEALLNSIANGIEPIDNTQIQKFAVMANDNREKIGLSLLIADDRAIIFNVLDCIQQIISKM